MSAYRAAIVGAGPAGLAAALTLARSLQPTVVFDSATPPRNATSPGIGGLLGRDLVAPRDLKAAGIEEIARYGNVRFVQQDVACIDVDPAGGFTLAAADGSCVRAASVLLACGMIDELPPFEDLDRFWGQSVINCPFCHGHELRDRPWGIFVNRPAMLDVAEIYTMWTDDLTLLLDDGIVVEPEREAELAAKGIRLEYRTIRRLCGEGSSLTAIEFDDGTAMDYEALVVWPPQRHTNLVAGLGLDFTDDGGVAVDESYRTAITGLYAAGDLLYAGHQNVDTALHMGNLAAAAMVLDLAQRGFARAT